MTREEVVNFLNTKQCTQQLAMDIVIEYAQTLRPQKDCDKLYVFLTQNPEFLNIAVTNSKEFIQRKYGISRIDSIKTGATICYL